MPGGEARLPQEDLTTEKIDSDDNAAAAGITARELDRLVNDGSGYAGIRRVDKGATPETDVDLNVNRDRDKKSPFEAGFNDPEKMRYN